MSKLESDLGHPKRSAQTMMVEERKDGSLKGRDPSSRGSVYDSRPRRGTPDNWKYNGYRTAR